MTDKTHWTVELVEDPETGELLLPFPTDMLAQVGWDFGDTLVWDMQGDTVIVTKKDDQD